MSLPRLVAAGLLLICLQLSAAAAEKAVPAPATLIDHYRQALAVDPDNALLRYFLGVSLLTGGRTEEAIAEFGHAYPALADSAEMNYNLGLAHARRGDPDSALLFFEQAEALGAAERPELFPLANAYYNLGLLYLDAGQLAQASSLFARVLAIDPGRLDVHRLLGDLYARGGQTEQALAEFSRYLTAFPEDEVTREYVFALHFNRGLELLERERSAEAHQAFRRALDLLPGSPLALYYLAYLETAEGRIEAAVEHLQKALPNATAEVYPGIRALLHNAALTLLEQRKLQRAAAAIAPLAERSAAEAADLNLAGSIHLALGDFPAAYRCFDRALAIDQENRQALQNRISAAAGALEEYFARARRSLDEEDFAAATAALEAAREIHPSDPRLAALHRQASAGLEQQIAARFAAARRDLARGEPRLALEAVRQGLQLAPEEPSGRALEEEILQQLERELAQRLAAADALLSRDELVAAQRVYREVLALDADHARALAGLEEIDRRRLQSVAGLVGQGETALEKGDLGAARTAFNEALELLPEHLPAQEGAQKVEALVARRGAEALQKGRQAAGAGRLEEAREHLLRALQIEENDQVRQELARLEETIADQLARRLQAARTARDRGEYRRARTLYAQLLSERPELPEVQREQAELAAEMQEAVRRSLDEAACHLRQPDYPAAISAFRRALEIDPVNARAQAGLEQSRTALQEEIAALVARGVESLDRGELSRAAETLNRALAMDPYHAGARSALRRLEGLRQTGLRPGDEEELYLQGIEWYTKGRYQEAIAAWEKVLTLAPGHEKARMNIEKAQRKVRQIREYRGG